MLILEPTAARFPLNASILRIVFTFPLQGHAECSSMLKNVADMMMVHHGLGLGYKSV